jgi:hypothetical protein
MSKLGPDGVIEFSWPGIASMSIRGGKEIEIETGDQEEINHARHLIAGLGLGLILHQRGVFTLHASTVAIGETAVAFAGAKRAGKSTTAAALSSRGHTLLSDDVLALEMQENGAPLVLPGPNTVNMWPDSAEALGQNPIDLPKIWPRSSKRICIASNSDVRGKVPLRCIFFLEQGSGESPSVERLDACEAISLLIGHSHALRIVEDLPALPQHLLQCGAVANSVEMLRLRRPRSLESIEGIARLVEDHVAGEVRVS